MATTNLNLTTIAGTDNPANFPAIYNDSMNKIDAFVGASDVGFTPEDGITSNLFFRKYGKVVCINGYIQGSSAFGTSWALLGVIDSGSRPTDAIRIPAMISTGYSAVGVIGNITVATNGQLGIKAPSGNTGTYCYFSCSYITA